MKFAALLAGFLVLGGCEPGNPAAQAADAGDKAAKPGEPYAISVAVDGEDRIIVLGAADGHRAAALINGAQEGALMDVNLAQARFAKLAPALDAGDPEVAIKLPMFSLQVDRDDKAAGAHSEEGDTGQVKIQIGAGKQTIAIDARDGARGGKDQALIRIDGADEQGLRDFLAQQEGVSEKLRVALLSELGLE